MAKHKSQFKNWKCRCSSLGHILTNADKVTATQIATIAKHEKRRDDPKQKDLTPTMKTELITLIAKRDAPDALSSGIKTHLDNIFRVEYWGRRRLLFNKFLDKGNICEADSLSLASDMDGFFYTKNEDYFENKWIKGTPDNKQEKIKDTKTAFDMESFDNADLSTLYRWQIKGYIWLLLNELKNYKGELIYCLVNNPYHQLVNEKNSLYYKMGTPEDNDPLFVEGKQQLERNMIFDIEAWNENYPNYDFDSTELDFDIPKHLRIKRWDVVLNSREIHFIKNRITLCREYLMEKETEVLDKIKAYASRKT